MLYDDLKPILIFFKLFGIIPLQNTWGKSDHLKVCATSFHTFFCALIKASILLTYFLLIRRTFSTTHVALLIGTILNELIQLKFFRGFIEFINQVERLDSTLEKLSKTTRKKKYRWLCVVVGVTIFNILIRLLFKQVISWKTFLKKILLIVIIFPSIMVPMSFIIICNGLTQRLKQLKLMCRNVEEQLIATRIFSIRDFENYRLLESIRLAYVQLCKAGENHVQLYDFPMAIYFLAFFLEAFYYCYLSTVLNEELHMYHLLRFGYNCCTIYAVTSATDRLKYEVLEFSRVLRKYEVDSAPFDIQNYVEVFMIQVQKNPITTDNSGYISINGQLLPSLATSFVTYFIVLVQLTPQLKN